jgi:DNA-binding response OmpR family regulator
MLRDVLIVTKNDAIRSIYDRAFRSHGIQVHLFEDLEDARAEARKVRHDIHIVDLECPTRAEIKCCRKMHECAPGVPLLLLGHEERAEGVVRETGADGYLVKPFTPTHLLERIRELQEELATNAEILKARQAERDRIEKDPDTHLLKTDVLQVRAEEIGHRLMDALGFLTLVSFAVRIDNFAALRARAGDDEADRVLKTVSRALEWWMWRRVDAARRRDIIGAHLGDGRFTALFAMRSSSDVTKLAVDLRALLRLVCREGEADGESPLPDFSVSILIRTTGLPERVMGLVKQAAEGKGCDVFMDEPGSFLWVDLDQT